MDSNDVATLRSVLGPEVTAERCEELLEAANGNIERACEIHFHQKEEGNASVSSATGTATPNNAGKVPPKSNDSKRSASPSKKTESKKRLSPTLSSSPTKSKQSRLDAFFFSSPKTKNTEAPKSQEHTSAGKTDVQSDVITVDDTLTSDGDVITVDDAPTNDGNTLNNKNIQKAISSMKRKDDKETSENQIDNVIMNKNDFFAVPFEDFANMLQAMADTTKRNEKLSLLESFIKSVWDKDRKHTTKTPENDLVCTGNSKIITEFTHSKAMVLTSSLELVLGGRTTKPIGVSGSAVSKALATTQGLSRNQLSKAYRQYGDLGDVAASFFQKRNSFFITKQSSRQQNRLSVIDVSQGLVRISETDGSNAKIALVQNLLRKCESRSEIRMLVRLLIANMRVGANLKTVLAALAMAVHSYTVDTGKSTPEVHTRKESSKLLSSKEMIELVQKTHDICPNLFLIIKSLLEGGIEQMGQDCTIQVLVPIAPMLAHPIHGIEELEVAISGSNVDKKLSNVSSGGGGGMTMEWKYDGMRCQAHYDGSSMKLFSRHMLEITDQFPDVVKFILDAFAIDADNASINSFIIDSEIVGVEGDHLLPFQELSTRRKKTESESDTGVKVKVFAFDLMLLNGTSLVNEPLYKRKELLAKSFKITTGFDLVRATKLETYDVDIINACLKEAVESGTEGLMLKQLGNDQPNSCTYEAGTRSRTWLKMKRDYLDGYADTIDVVPIGAWYGNGRKAQKSFLSPVLLAVYDEEEDVFRSISRCMSFTDKMYESMKAFYFHGIPYPQNADGSQDKEDSEQKNSDDDLNGDNAHCLENDDDDNGSSTESGQDENPSNEFVNCFPSKPSSAYISTNEEASIWFKPLEVFEVSFADLTLSRTHTAAMGLVDEEGRGVAMRFPRFKRRRPDKRPEQATTCTQIAQLFAQQTKIRPGNTGSK